MSTINEGTDVPLVAAEDLSSSQYLFVTRNSSGEAALLNAFDDAVEGVLQNAPESGNVALVRRFGESKIVANALIAINTPVKAEFVSTSDTGKADDATDTPFLARGIMVEATGAEDDVGVVYVFPQIPQLLGHRIQYTVVTAQITTSSNVTYTAAQMLGGHILRDPGAARDDKVDTADNVIAELNKHGAGGIGSSFEFVLQNDAGASEVITLTTDTGMTMTGTMTVAQNFSTRFLVVVTGSTTCTVYNMGTFTS